jgi:hypothetical protein
LTTLFPSVECRTLFLPHTDRKKLQDLSKVAARDLTADFRRELQELRDLIIDRITRRPNNGEFFVSLLRAIVEASNDARGFFPQVPSLWASFLQSQVNEALEVAKRLFEHDVKLEKAVPPAVLAEQIARACGNAVVAYQSMLFNQSKFYQPNLPVLKTFLEGQRHSIELQNIRFATEAAESERARTLEEFVVLPDMVSTALSPELKLRTTLQQHEQHFLDRFNRDLTEYLAFREVQSVLQHLKSDLELRRLQRETQNTQRLLDHLSLRQKAAQSNYTESFSSILDAQSPFNYTELTQRELPLRQAVLQQFRQELAVLIEAPRLEELLRDLSAKLDAVKAAVWDTNLGNLKKLFAWFWSVFTLAEWERESDTFPTSDKKLAHRLQQLREQELQAFQERFERYRGMDVYQSQLAELQKRITDQSDKLHRKNEEKVCVCV